MSLKTLDAEQICSIIEACGKHKVLTLKFHGLEIWFGPQALPQTLPGFPSPSEWPTVIKNQPVAEMTDTQHKKLDEEALRENERLLREQQIEELKITDPLAYEQMVRDGEIGDVDNESGDE